MNLPQSVEVVVLFLAVKSIHFTDINMENSELVGLESVDFDEDIILSEDIFVRDGNNSKITIREDDLEEGLDVYEDEIMLETLPKIVFVDEDLVSLVVAREEECSFKSISSAATTVGNFRCNKCSKVYKCSEPIINDGPIINAVLNRL